MRWQTADSRLTSLIPAETPLFGFAHSVDVVIALSRAGGVGIWGATRSTPEEIEEGLAAISKALDGQPFGVDLVLPQNMPDHDDRESIEVTLPAEHREFIAGMRAKYAVPDDGLPGMRSRFVRSEEMARRQLDVVLASDVHLVGMGIGTPAAAVDEAKGRGKTVVSLVGAPRHAERAIAAGADILVAQGTDAGGHTGNIGTFSLVPRIIDVADGRPVLAAGGITTGRHVAAALSLGASGVWTGTTWLATHEHALDAELVRQILAADVTDTVISRGDSGKTLRQIRTAWSDEWASEGAPVPLPMPYQDILIGDLLGSIHRHRVLPLMHTPAGQGVGYVRELESVQDIYDRLVRDADAALTAVGRRSRQ